MAPKYIKPRGTQDILPAESWKWHCVEQKMQTVVSVFGYNEIRLPTFESTEVFSRGVGEGTDIVSKEMYTFEDKGGRSVTLRPEGTAGVVRAVLENGLLSSSPMPLKSYYLQSCFRYEKAQKGRLREFHQLGIECFGTHAPEADAEVIEIAYAILTAFGVSHAVELQINSIGCRECRPAYHKKLREFFESRKEQLCETCLERLEKNPMRILDCKEEKCQVIAKEAPVMLEHLCDDCSVHFTSVKTLLDEAEIAYVVNPTIVRGLDYYTNTVFEYVAAGVGTQGTVCAGGRYDGLIEELGGTPTPAVGFGLGIERFIMLLEEHGCFTEHPTGPALYAVGMGENGSIAARELVRKIRHNITKAEYDISGRSVKAQMKAAGRTGALYTTVLGDDEVASGIVHLKRMKDGAEVEIPLASLPYIFNNIMKLDPVGESEEPLDSMLAESGPMLAFDE